ncbi:MAG: SIS domain-containing protein [Bacillota bacterium]
MQSSIMWQYIGQEPEVLSKLLQSSQTDEFAAEKGTGLKAVYFVAHGSSYNAAVCTLGFFSKYANVRAYAYTPGNFCSGCSAVAQEEPASTLVAVISQTGTSSGAIKALEYAASLGFSTLSITAAGGSPVAVKADDSLDLMCGEEDSNAKTKGYSATLTLLLLLALSIGFRNGAVDTAEKQAVISEISGMIHVIPEVSDKVLDFCKKTGFGENMPNLYVLGSGINYGTALEGQLKLMETMCIPAMFNDIGEFSHGMHRSIDAGSNVLLIKGCDEMKDQVEQAYQYLKGITRYVWIIDAAGEETGEPDRLLIPSFHRTQSVLLTTLAVQVMSVYAPELNGKDPNRNANDDFTVVAGTRT